MPTNDTSGEEPAGWRIKSPYGGNPRPLHESLDCPAVRDPSHYRPVDDPGRLAAGWCPRCTPPFDCPECGREFDTHAAMRGHTSSHVDGTGQALADRIRGGEIDTADLGLSPIGDRPSPSPAEETSDD